MRFIDGRADPLAVGELTEGVAAVDVQSGEHGELAVAHGVDGALRAEAPREPERGHAQIRGSVMQGGVGGRDRAGMRGGRKHS